MIFKRIDDENVSCIIDADDMRKYDIDFDDLLNNSGKAHDFLKNIVERAVEEVDFKVSEGALSFRIMALSESSLSLVLSENPLANISSFLEHLKEISNLKGNSDISLLGNIFKECDDVDVRTEDAEDLIKRLVEDITDSDFVENVDNKKKVDKDELGDMKDKRKKVSGNGGIKIFRFETMKDVEKFCSCIPKKVYVKSSLFKDNDSQKYYFVMEKSHISASKFNAIAAIAVEFSTFITGNRSFYSHLSEHYACIIENKAVKILRRMALNE